MSFPRVKYPRTAHLPFSESRSEDDLTLPDLSVFDGQEVVVTEKMDGENTTFRRDSMHTRSIEGLAYHPSRTAVQALHGQVAFMIEDGVRVCGENVFALHSVGYDRLPGYFLMFAVFDDRTGVCWSWDETERLAAELGLPTVPVLYRGVWDEEKVRACFPSPRCGPDSEGFVVRPTDGFPIAEFTTRVGKYVRRNHVQTDQHWLRGQVMPNRLASA